MRQINDNIMLMTVPVITHSVLLLTCEYAC